MYGIREKLTKTVSDIFNYDIQHFYSREGRKKKAGKYLNCEFRERLFRRNPAIVNLPFGSAMPLLKKDGKRRERNGERKNKRKSSRKLLRIPHLFII